MWTDTKPGLLHAGFVGKRLRSVLTGAPRLVRGLARAVMTLCVTALTIGKAGNTKLLAGT